MVDSVTPPVTLDQLKQELNMDPTGTDNDAELTIRLLAATRAVEGVVGPMVPRTITIRRVVRGTSIALPVWPVLDVATITGRYGAASYTTDDIDVGTGGVVSLARGCLAPGRYDIAYTAGRDPVGENLQLATLIIAAHLWETQRGRSARARSLGDFDSGNPQQDAMLVLRGFAFPRRAIELMQADDPGLVFA